MKIVIFWNNWDWDNLFKITKESLDELGLSEFIEVESTSDETYKTALNISETPAFCIEEPAMDFKDMLFEWQVPEKNEISNLMIALIWWDDWSCSSSECHSCAWCWH